MKISVAPWTAEFTRPDHDSAGLATAQTAIRRGISRQKSQIVGDVALLAEDDHGKVINELGREVARVGGGGHIQQGGFCRDRHSVGYRAELKGDVGSQLAVVAETRNTVANYGSKPFLLDHQAVGPDRQVGCQVVADIIGFKIEPAVGFDVYHLNLGRGDDGSVWILGRDPLRYCRGQFVRTGRMKPQSGPTREVVGGRCRSAQKYRGFHLSFRAPFQ